MVIEIKITHDAKTGETKYEGPPDKIIGIGLLEVAKHMLISNRPKPSPLALPRNPFKGSNN